MSDRKPRGYWTKGRCVDCARQCIGYRDFNRRFKGACRAAEKYGWMDACRAVWPEPTNNRRTLRQYVQVLAERGITVSPAEGRADDLIYTKRKMLHQCDECGHQWEVRPNTVLQRASGCPSCASNVCDLDALYLWEWAEDGKGTGIYKPGVTSWRLGEERIKKCARDNGISYALIALCQTSEGDAKVFEWIFKDMGEKPALPDHIVDGRTEFRIYSESELAFINQLLGVSESALAMAA